MKIYTKHVSQWLPDGSLVSVPDECESFDYEGPVDQCGAMGTGQPPQPFTRTGVLSLRGQQQLANSTGQASPLGVHPSQQSLLGGQPQGAIGQIFGGIVPSAPTTQEQMRAQASGAPAPAAPRVPNPMPSGANSAGKQASIMRQQALVNALRR